MTGSRPRPLAQLVAWGIDIYDVDVLHDLFRQLPPGSMETKDASRYAFKDIEYQRITNPKKIEVLSLNKIGKQVVSGRGGGTTKFEGKESAWTEALACYALAFRQHTGRDVTAAEFKQFLIDGKNGNTSVR